MKKRPTKGWKLDVILAGEVVEPDLERFMNKGANERLLIINIKSVPAIGVLDEILSVPDLDGLLRFSKFEPSPGADETLREYRSSRVDTPART